MILALREIPKRPITAGEVQALEPGQFLRVAATVEDFHRLLEELPERRTSRVRFARGTLEVAIPTDKHEYVKNLLNYLVVALAEELGLWADSFGSMTFRKRGTDVGGEPDDCFYIYKDEAARPVLPIDLDSEPAPGLVIEIDFTHSSEMKNELYAAYGVSEIWRYNDKSGKVSIHRLSRGTPGKYVKALKSRLLPDVTTHDINLVLEQAPPNRKAVQACIERLRARGTSAR